MKDFVLNAAQHEEEMGNRYQLVSHCDAGARVAWVLAEGRTWKGAALVESLVTHCLN